MAILKNKVDYESIHKELEEQEELERIRGFLWSNVPITAEETWTSWYSSDAGVYTDEYNPDGSKKEPINKIREREHTQAVAQVASSRRQFNSNQRQYSQRNQPRQNRCTNQRGRR